MTDHPAPPPADAPRRSWVPVVLGVALVVVGAGALFWNYARTVDTTTMTFDTAGIEQVVIESEGSVTLRVGDIAEATVREEWVFRGPAVTMSQEGGTMRVVADCGFFSFACRTGVDATAPADAAIEVVTAAGNVTVEGFQAGVDLETSAGNVLLSGIAGDALLRSSAGRIEGDITDGDVDAETSAGRIELDIHGEFQSVSAVTSAGNVGLTVPDGVYRVDADTSAGGVQVNVPTDPDAERRIVARSSAGSIRVDPR